jgi:MFS family permease
MRPDREEDNGAWRPEQNVKEQSQRQVPLHNKRASRWLRNIAYSKTRFLQFTLNQDIIVAMGLSGGDVILLSTAVRWFAKRRGVMTGIIKVGTGVGMIIMPIFINWLITSYGWRISFMVLGILLLVSVLPLAQFLVGDPATLGQLSDGERNPTAENSTLGEPGLTLVTALATRQFWMICLISLLILFCVFTILVHIVPHAIDLGISASRAASILALMGAASIAGRIFMGSASDRFGNRVALSLCFLLMTSGLVWLQLAKELSAFYVFAVAHGFAHGGFFSLLSPTTAALFGTRSHGVLFGIVIFSGTLGGFMGPIFAGYVFDITNSYQMVFLTLTILSIIGLLSTIALRPSVGAGLQQKQAA